MLKICILDYGLGNIKSLYNALNKIGQEIDFFSDNKKKNYDLVFIPGVGSYNKASEILLQPSYLDFLNNKNKHAKIFGICLGMQLFSTDGEENKVSNGLNYIPGKTKKLYNDKENLTLPFVGYFGVKFKKNNFLNKFSDQKFYFVHSYHFNPNNPDSILAETKHQNLKYCSAVINERFIGTQFHPEKSGEIGLEFFKTTIKNFV